jgi:UDP-N-acetylglucosamine 2-epimerase (non-hydrolysing)
VHDGRDAGGRSLAPRTVKLLSVVGARPQFVKLGPVAAEAARRGIEHVIVHTGQHYEPAVSDVFFADLGIAEPDVHLAVGSGTHGEQTGAILTRMDPVLATHRPDWVMVYGDTNSTLAGALAAAKMQVPVAHLEAGLRSFNRGMPEEHNRVLTDHVADLLLAPTQVAMGHLAAEGLAARSRLVGDVMVDVLQRQRAQLSHPEAVLARLRVVSGSYSLATIHRAENTDDPARLETLVAALAGLGHPVLLLVHPRLRDRAAQHGIALDRGSLRSRAPLTYPELIATVDRARAVITDSGGLQKEAFLLGVPCTTVRGETEWVETLENDWNVLVEPGPALVAAASRPRPEAIVSAPYGNGHAAAAALDALSS